MLKKVIIQTDWFEFKKNFLCYGQKNVDKRWSFLYIISPLWYAGVAQSVEQLTCNQQVGGSIPFASFSSWGDSRVAKGGRL